MKSSVRPRGLMGSYPITAECGKAGNRGKSPMLLTLKQFTLTSTRATAQQDQYIWVQSEHLKVLHMIPCVGCLVILGEEHTHRPIYIHFIVRTRKSSTCPSFLRQIANTLVRWHGLVPRTLTGYQKDLGSSRIYSVISESLRPQSLNFTQFKLNRILVSYFRLVINPGSDKAFLIHFLYFSQCVKCKSSSVTLC